MSSLPSERVAVCANIDPDAYAAAVYTSGYMSMAKYRQAMAIIQAGTLGASATINAKIVQATDSAGTGSKDVTGKAITALTQAGTDSDKQAIINVHHTDLDITNGFDFIAVQMTVGVATSDAGAILLGFDAAFEPASDDDASTVDEIIK